MLVLGLVYLPTSRLAGQGKAVSWVPDNTVGMARTGNGSLASSRLVPREVHLRDLVAVVTRHWRIVVLLAILVPAGAYFTGRRSVPRYQSRLTVQVSSQKQVYSQFENIRVDEMALRTDPVLSEALVLTTQRLALRVVDALHLQLEPLDQTLLRGSVFTEITVDSTARSEERRVGKECRSRWSP